MISVKPKITFSCPEKWEAMKIGLVSRYCENCKRDVQDFTNYTKEEILHFLWNNRDKKVCGRVFKSQLDYHREEILITIESYIKKNKNTNLSFYLLALSAMLMAGCTTEDFSKLPKADSVALTADSNQGVDEYELNGSEAPRIDEVPILGMVVTVEPTIEDANEPRFFAEVMPEFIGGIEALNDYLKSNLKYPQWEKSNGIQGTVFVSFTIDRNGKVVDPKIVKTVIEAKNFDSEVLRIVNAMPRWKPGRERGNTVAVKFTLPVKFKL